MTGIDSATVGGWAELKITAESHGYPNVSMAKDMQPSRMMKMRSRRRRRDVSGGGVSCRCPGQTLIVARVEGDIVPCVDVFQGDQGPMRYGTVGTTIGTTV